ncbi:MAG: TetR/AcrR family transcriptional regulator [Mesorhizobium sp.]|uniref:TetR/AcrR family transcriptional regulator n=1 Tax=Mesorhizobium sp. TaxID=1871066 RepID=UPI001ACBB149|nr:TetR/AcrR family transcriptional regulator [Mesorhizobium sp.]MBN9219226.1 TetR/AcrR family transcriptional regulator [Mesorhizobium sp.]
MSKLSNTADEILAAARTFIVSGGYNGFSYADIAEVIGIRKASIHHHFPSKADLVQTLLKRYLDDAVTGLGGLERNVPEPPELLRAYAGIWARCIEDSSMPFCVCALLASELPALPPEVGLEVRAYFRFLSKWLADVIARGAETGTLVISASPRVEAEAFMATVHGAMLSARAYGDVLTFGMILTPTLRKLNPAAD